MIMMMMMMMAAAVMREQMANDPLLHTMMKIRKTDTRNMYICNTSGLDNKQENEYGNTDDEGDDDNRIMMLAVTMQHKANKEHVNIKNIKIHFQKWATIKRGIFELLVQITNILKHLPTTFTYYNLCTPLTKTSFFPYTSNQSDHEIYHTNNLLRINL